MSIKESFEKIKGYGERAKEALRPEKLLERSTFIALVVVLTALASFALGRLSALEANREPVRITFPEGREKGISAATSLSVPMPQASAPGRNEEAGKPQGMYVGSKNGTKYHLPWCSGAKRISDANKVWFASKEEAASAGYTPAANCKGM